MKLAPLLPQVVLQDLATGYGAIFIVEDWISKVQVKRDEVKAQVEQWVNDMLVHSSFLLQLERRWRIAQMVDLLLGRPTFPTPGGGEQGIQQVLEEKRRKLSELFEVKQR